MHDSIKPRSENLNKHALDTNPNFSTLTEIVIDLGPASSPRKILNSCVNFLRTFMRGDAIGRLNYRNWPLSNPIRMSTFTDFILFYDGCHFMNRIEPRPISIHVLDKTRNAENEFFVFKNYWLIGGNLKKPRN